MRKNAKKGGGGGNAPASRIADKRFASFETDPRFRLPSKKHAKTAIDKRFAGMLTDNDFTATSKVDRYGRKLKSDSKKKALERLYRLEDESAEDDAEEKEGEEEDEEDENEDEEEEDVDPDELVQRELRKAHEKYDPARGGGFSSSESDSDSSGDDDSDDGSEGGAAEGAEATVGDMQRFQDEQAGVEPGEVTRRIAVVNLDWDHVRSADLMALFSSFLPAEDGRVERVSVYPSEFGKERMQQEEVEGPPKALFKNQKDKSDSNSDDSEDDDDDDDEKIRNELVEEGNDEDFDSDALRAYQLDRLRYYYAVMTCSTPAAAKKVYDATDGTEYQSSSNFLDLRFVPDDVSFDADEPRDECDAVPEAYKPVEFVTNALQSSKVRLTWDMHPEEASRKDSIKRAFGGSRNEIEESDLKAYLASDSEDEEEEEDAVGEEERIAGEDGEEDAPKLSKKELARKKMREALGLGDEPASRSKDSSGPSGGMEVTFTPALSGDNNSKAKKSDADAEETTIEKYKRKERERKEKKRQAAKAKRQGVDAEEEEQDSDTEAVIMGSNGDGGDDETEDLGFDDPFFTSAGQDAEAPSKTAQRKQDRLKKRQAKEAQAALLAAEKSRLEAVMNPSSSSSSSSKAQAERLDHFDMADVLRSEKHRSKKGKRAEKKAAEVEARGATQAGFEMDVADDRFRAVFDSHEYAIDPSNPKFKGTEGMRRILEEGRRKRHGGGGGGDEEGVRPAKKSKKNRR
ncbi:hypothetical protein N3K66_008958 [Trichothecium roseum]|uniref:Uncharacterized protein n=1 Tax=Trichothecium roseum TaxID=47278 RepID=A0ACC0UPN8_9HYPO|nr:hypothetical protein N3K66_008958 [Trichothecium roseum]